MQGSKRGNVKLIEGGGKMFIRDSVDPDRYIGGTVRNPYGPGKTPTTGIKRTDKQYKQYKKLQAQQYVDRMRLEGIQFKMWQDRNRTNNGTKLNP